MGGYGDDLQFVQAQIFLDKIILNKLNGIQEFYIDKKIKYTFNKHILVFLTLFLLSYYIFHILEKSENQSTIN